MVRGHRSLVALVTVCMLLVSACSRFERRGTSAELVVGEETIEVATTVAGGDAGIEATSTSTSSTTIDTLTPPATAAPSSPQPVEGRTVVRTGVANRSVVDHPGWRVSLTVGARGDEDADAEIAIEVRLGNTSDRDRYHQVDQPDSVVITTRDEPDRRAWSHLACNPTLAVYEQPGGLRVIEAGDEIAMVVRYPFTEDCRLPPGEYLVFGQWSVCPDGSQRETANPGTFRCEDGHERFVDAGPVPLRLR